MLATNGGAYALSAARAGKTWIMQTALAEVEGKGGLTLWYPSRGHDHRRVGCERVG